MASQLMILLKSYYFKSHNYDIICLSETFLNSSIESNNDGMSIDGYNLIRSDHRCGSKGGGGVCIYFKKHIPLIKRGHICTLDNCFVREIRPKAEKYFQPF